MGYIFRTTRSLLSKRTKIREVFHSDPPEWCSWGACLSLAVDQKKGNNLNGQIVTEIYIQRDTAEMGCFLLHILAIVVHPWSSGDVKLSGLTAVSQQAVNCLYRLQLSNPVMNLNYYFFFGTFWPNLKMWEASKRFWRTYWRYIFQQESSPSVVEEIVVRCSVKIRLEAYWFSKKDYVKFLIKVLM